MCMHVLYVQVGFLCVWMVCRMLNTSSSAVPYLEKEDSLRKDKRGIGG